MVILEQGNFDMQTSDPVIGRPASPGRPVPHISFDEFTAFGRRALIRADIPVVIELPRGTAGLGRDGIAERLGDMQVTLFTEPSNKNNPVRWTTREIPLREFFEDSRYETDPSTWHRIVSNIRKSTDDINTILGFDANEVFDYGGSLSAANLWISHKGVFTQNHFDEWENFNVALEGRKRFVMAPPGVRDYYPRSLPRGFGDKSQVFDLDNVDPKRFPRLIPKLSERREVILEPGQILYLPLGWWHQAESLEDMNVNMNFWIHDAKILRRPYVMGVAMYTKIYRRLKRVYNYKPAERISS